MVFDFEKMEVYQISLKMLDKSVALSDTIPRGHKYLSDQLKRATSSISLNISEGVGEYKPKEKARFYRIALRSVSETCSIIQICHRLKMINTSGYQESYVTLTRISKMLTKLIHSVENRNIIRDREPQSWDRA